MAGAGQEKATVEVWRVSLDPDERTARALAADLSADELERLERLGPQVARRWLAGRAAMRAIVAARLGVAPSALRLTVSEHGRPRLDTAAHPVPLDFNLSHSAGLALIALSDTRRVGIDVEWVRRGRDPLPIAERYFSAAEVGALRALPVAERGPEFFRYWTAKEALAKGLGLGLKAPLRELELSRQPGGAMAPTGLGSDWRLLQLADLPDGYCGALALDAAADQVTMRDWRPRG